ncbi:MAG: pitrilysin family protein [Longimicrobiales bacterium]
MNVPDRTSPPEAGPIRPFDFPDVDRRRLPNGLALHTARMGRLPVVSVNLFMRAGEAALDPMRAGLAVLAGDALEGGTRQRSGADLAEALERIGARLGASTGWEGTSVSLSCLASRLEQGLALLAEAVLEPDFPDAEVGRARNQQLARIRQARMDPGALASDEIARRIFAANVPYARAQLGTAESVGAFGARHLHGYTDACWRPEAGGLVVVGDVDADEIEAMAAEAFAGWEGAAGLAADFEVAPATTERRVWIVDRPGSVQSEIRVGHVGASRTDPGLPALKVMNTLFGGTFTSRLNLNLRERNGFTYGVRSRFALRSRPGPFVVSTAVGSEVTAAAVGEIMTELDTLVASGVRAEEVEAARDFMAGVFPLRLETVGQVASRLTESVVYGLPDDFHATYRERIRGVTPEDANGAVRRYVRPGEAQIVVVGDASAVRQDVDALGLGPVEVLPATE